MVNVQIWGLIVALAAGGMSISCKDKKQPAGSSTSGPDAEDNANLCDGGEPKGAITWFHDDFEMAQACAQTQGVPLVVDMWAPWCHTCLSMQSTVLIDPALAPYSKRFVWVAIDTDKPRNANVVEAFAPAAWPTFFVIDPVKSELEARFVGSSSVAQFIAFLHEGEAAYLAKANLDPNSPLGLLRAGERAATEKEWEAAQAAFQNALAKAPADWPRRADVMVSLLQTFRKSAQWQPCLDFATKEMNNTGNSASASDFITIARMCLQGRGARQSKTPDAMAFRKLATERLQRLLANAAASTELTVDDRSDAMVNLRELLDEQDQHDVALAIAEAQRALLDEAAAKAPAASVAMTYNWPRSEVYTYLGKPLELVPALEKSIDDLPTEYDPPYRLAWIYLQAKDYDKATSYAMDAYKLGYGVRKTRISKLLIDIATAQDNADALRKARELHLAALLAVPATQQDVAQIREMNKVLAGIDTPKAMFGGQ